MYAVRQASNLRLSDRIELHTERDALLHRLAVLDHRLDELSEERRAIVAELGAVRDELYPEVPWTKGRRPPALDHAPLPPAPAEAQPVTGRDLRSICRQLLLRHGPLALRELHGLLHRYGYAIDATRPVTALSDAMAYEVESGRAQRLERGVYEAIGERPHRRRKPRPWATVPRTPPADWLTTNPTPLDPTLAEDPTTWIPSVPLIPPR